MICRSHREARGAIHVSHPQTFELSDCSSEVFRFRDADLAENPSVPGALAAFEAARRPIVEKLVAAADASGQWYERFPEHMRLAPREFAWSYIQRSGRVDPERLRRIAPKFVAG